MTSDRRHQVAVYVGLVLVLLGSVLVLAPVVADLGSGADGSQRAGRGAIQQDAQRTEPEVLIGRRRPPNILLIMVDDMRDDDLRYMPRTRRLLADQGVRFANSFSPYPTCCPARASELTGLYTHNHGVYSMELPWGFTSFDDDSTLATWLHDSGYTTSYLGKYLNGYGWMPEPGRSSGTSVDYVPPGWDHWYASIDGGLPLTHPDAGGTYAYYDTTISDDGDGFRNFAGRYQTRVYGRMAARMVRDQAASRKPYFFHLSFTAPHSGVPVEPDDPLPVRGSNGVVVNFPTPARPLDARGRFDDTIAAAPGSSWRDPDFSDKPRYLQDRSPLRRADRRALLKMARQRAEAMWVLDREVERTLAAVRDSGEARRTVVLFTSDNGYFLGEQRRRRGKIFPHEPSLRVPFLIRGPGIPAGQVRSDPITSIDIAPTLASLVGIRPPAPVDGISLARVARRGDEGWTRGVLTETGPFRKTSRVRFLIGVRTWRYLYVGTAPGGRELYDVQRDPREYHNLAVLPSYDGVERRLARVVARLQDCDGAECNEPLPRSLQHPVTPRR